MNPLFRNLASVIALLGSITLTSNTLAEMGPDILRAPPPRAPQLENTGVWSAKPIMICHASAYRAGEFVHQGCVYDDQGAQLKPLKWPFHAITFAYRYPTAEAYRQNAADLVEVRIKPLADATAIRLTYNTMIDPELVAATIAIGGDTKQPRTVPHGANMAMPADIFATVHGRTADLIDASNGGALSVNPAVTVDVERRQVEIRIPYSAFNPSGKKVRFAVAAGLWDRAKGRYLVPKLGDPDEKTPGAGLLAGLGSFPAFFDVAFRHAEPFDSPWRNDLQKKALAARNIDQFFAMVDFNKLAAKVDDEMTGSPEGVPKSGFMNRLFASQFESKQGRRLPADENGPPLGSFTTQNGLTKALTTPSLQFGWVCRDNCVPDMPGQLQRYTVYVPSLPAPTGGYASMYWTPGYGQSGNDQVNDVNYEGLFPAGARDLFRQVANRPEAPTVVVTVDGRGNDMWYYGQSGASVFEVIADTRRAFKLDPARTVMSGFSSGGYGANKLSLQFPDTFSKAFICDGLNMAPSIPGINALADTILPAIGVDVVTRHEAGSRLTPLLPSRRNQPVMEWAGLPDDFIPYNITRERAQAYIAGDYDFDFVTWPGLAGEHVIMCANGMWPVLNRWLGDMRGVERPFHVTFVRNPAWDDPKSGMVGDKAYWISTIQTRSGGATDLGTIDAISRGFGLVDAPNAPVALRAGLQTGTTVIIPNPFTSERRTKSAPKSVPAQDRIDITARNIRTITIDPVQAQVTCNVDLKVKTDGPLTVRIAGCGPDRQFN